MSVFRRFAILRMPGRHRLSVPVSIAGEVGKAFHGLENEGKLRQGTGIFSYDGFQIHI